MNIVRLNTTGSDFIIKGGNTGGGGGGSTPSSGWTGHADAEGLKAIGWTDEDIAYYQEHGVNWNAEDDEYHKVTDDNKALYGVLTANNIKTYKDRIVYLPKIDTSGVTRLDLYFGGCSNMIGLPVLDTQKANRTDNMFNGCYSLACIPPLDMPNVTNADYMFRGCSSLVFIPPLDMPNVTSVTGMFYGCYSLVDAPPLDMPNVTSLTSLFNRCYSLRNATQFNTPKVTSTYEMFYYCRALTYTQYDMLNVTNANYMFDAGICLSYVKLNNLSTSLSFKDSEVLKKDSLLYIINNESSTSAITITLNPVVYDRLSTDADIVSALATHPNITLARY